MNKSPQYDPFTKKKFLSLIFSMILNLSDYGSDIIVAILLYNENDTDWWFALTVLLIIVPLLIVNLFSIFWYHQVITYHNLNLIKLINHNYRIIIEREKP